MDAAASTPDHRFDLVSSRVLEASPAKVFATFADPAVLARWWGPKDFSDTIELFEFRVGGTWKHTLHAPDGTDYPNLATFRVIEAPNRIVFDHNSGKRFTLRFEPAPGGRARFSLAMTFESAEARDAIRALIEVANEENIDRLAAVLRP